VGLERGVGRRGDVVVDGDVAEEVGAGVGVGYGDGVAGLQDWGRIDDLLDARVGVGAEPGIGGVDMADDVDLIAGAGIDVDVARAGGDGDAGCAGDGEGFVKGAFGGEGGGGGEDEESARRMRRFMVTPWRERVAVGRLVCSRRVRVGIGGCRPACIANSTT
jgi:hypothetical protein